jgi:hypothetical protein
MTNSEFNYDLTGSAVRASGWYGFGDNLHTVSIKYDSLLGNIHVQATLSLNPTESDWFEIDINPDKTIPELPLTRKPYLILGEGLEGDSGVVTANFVGNFTYARAILSRTERDDLDPDPQNPTASTGNQGTVDKILMSF